MSSKGTLKLGSALMQLHDARASGIVRFERGTTKKQLVLRAGRVAFGESNKPEEHLVRVLIRLGMLPNSALSTVASLMKNGMTADAALLSGGQTDLQTIHVGVREQVTEIVASLLGSDDVLVRYYAGQDLLGRDLDAAIEVPPLLTSAARRASSGRPCALPQGLVSLFAGGLTLGMKLPLEPAEAYACALAVQPLGVEDFANLMPAGAVAPTEILTRLLLLGLIHIQPAEAKTQKPQPEPSKAPDVEELLRRFEVADYYEILSVPADTDQDAVKAAYHKLARQYHPDLFQAERFGAELKEQISKLFTYITAAYTTLSNPASRTEYDEQRAGSKVEAKLQARASADLEKEKAALALFRVGQRALLEKDFEKAVMTLSESVFLRPDVAKYRRVLGCAQSEIPRHRKEAEQNLLKAVELDPMALESYIALGKLYMKVNLTRRAEAQFRQVLQWDPGNPEAERRLKELAQV